MSSNEIMSIEQIGKDNGCRRWDARKVSDFLGYKTYQSFKNVINRSISSASLVNADVGHEFRACNNKEGQDTYNLTRFALLLCVQNADKTKEMVSKAQTYLSAFTNAMFEENLSRIDARVELTNNEKAMTGAAINAGLESNSIAFFKDSGYRGLYNMNLQQLKTYKGFNKSGTLYDYMNSTELAANSLRVALTRDNLNEKNNLRENEILDIAQKVGKGVRKLVQENSGKNPEDIPLSEEKINKIKSEIKKEGKQINNQREMFDKKL